MTTFEYTGSDTLEIMQEAINYNASLASLVLKQNIPSMSKILDIGAGIGVFAEIIRNAGYDVTCLEPDLSQALVLKRKNFTVHTSADTIDDESFNFMYAFNVLEHIADDEAALVTWRKKLKPGGKLLIYVPAFDILFSSMDEKVGHFRRYRRKTLEQTTAKAAFVPVCKAEYMDSLGFFITLAYKLFYKQTGKIDRKSLIFYDRVLFPVSKITDIFLKKLIGKNTFITVQK
jgi:2-polyprenyl-3-methyl-5-hydroxy-6-metoxy-1,4-benzoquinol methylase